MPLHNHGRRRSDEGRGAGRPEAQNSICNNVQLKKYIAEVAGLGIVTAAVRDSIAAFPFGVGRSRADGSSDGRISHLGTGNGMIVEGCASGYQPDLSAATDQRPFAGCDPFSDRLPLLFVWRPARVARGR